MFQDYALFPHMSVLENVAYGLRVRGVRGRRATAACREMLELVQLGAHGRALTDATVGRTDASASRWRARSSISRRCCCSMNRWARSDLKLREEMQIELKNLQRRLRHHVRVT